MSNLLSIYNTFESQRRQDRQRQEEQQSQQDRLLSSQVLQRLDSFKDDPARYKAFRDGAVLAVPEVKGALERVFTPQGLKTIIDDSTLESPEERLQRKTQEHMVVTLAQKRAEAAADADPKLNQMITLGKAMKQAGEDKLALDPGHRATQNFLAEEKALNDQRIKAKELTTDAYQAIQNEDAERRSRDEYLPKFISEHAVVKSAVQMAIADPKKAADAWMTINGDKNSNKDSNALPLANTLYLYHKSKIIPPGAVVRSVLSSKHVTEDEYKREEASIADSLQKGYLIEDGKPFSLDKPLNESGKTYRRVFVNRLLKSNLTGEMSPYAGVALPWMVENSKLNEGSNAKKNSDMIQSVRKQLSDLLDDSLKVKPVVKLPEKKPVVKTVDVLAQAKKQVTKPKPAPTVPKRSWFERMITEPTEEELKQARQ